MPIGKLIGYAAPVQAPISKLLKILGKNADHTYVISSNGDVYPCHGGSNGGVIVCSGPGNTDQAKCLAQKDLKAGILYGITGVCHQTANRILTPCGQIVSKAVGYRTSSFAWGDYGIDLISGLEYSPYGNEWDELLVCKNHHSHP